MSTIVNRVELTNEILRSGPIFHAFTECSDELQEHARKLLATITDPSTDEDDRTLAAMTLADILFPEQGELGADIEASEGGEIEPAVQKARENMDREEATFADRLRAVMQERGVTQVQLAEKIGVGQSAIAMMLQRECRPQSRTVARMAEALGVTPEDLWGERKQTVNFKGNAAVEEFRLFCGLHTPAVR